MGEEGGGGGGGGGHSGLNIISSKNSNVVLAAIGINGLDT